MARDRTSLLQGTLDLIVLQMLQAEPTNGYDLMLRIQADRAQPSFAKAPLPMSVKVELGAEASKISP